MLLDQQLAELPRLAMAELKARYELLLGCAAPGYNRVYLERRLACRLQEIAHGGLPPATRDRLNLLLREEGLDSEPTPGNRKKKPATKRRPRLLPGTRLLRDHAGVQHEVLVLVDGFEYRGQKFTSLSRIALAITGVSWNGYRFFGLRQIAVPKQKSAVIPTERVAAP